jgi:ferredoxin, 2Fe-2S
MKVRFIDPSGREHVVEGLPGENAMRCATRALIPGVLGECGGAMACATCAAPPPPRADEQDMVSGCLEVRPNSRLTCQVILTPEMDGITFVVPSTQV